MKTIRTLVTLALSALAWISPPCFASDELDGGGFVDPQHPPSDSGPKGSVLVFSDEFNGQDLDREKWNIGVNTENILHDRLDSVYKSENVGFKDGSLVLTARHEPDGVVGRTFKGPRRYSYSAGALNTVGKFHLRQNMYIEARVKLPTNEGGRCVFLAMPNPEEDAGFNDPPFWRGLDNL